MGDGSDLVNTLFIDAVVGGGGDLRFDNGNGSLHVWEIPSNGNWASDGSQNVTITGIALPIWANSTNATNNTLNGTFTFTFYGLGSDAAVGANYAGDTLIGTTTATFESQNTGVNPFFVNFDTPVVWSAADSDAFSVAVTSDAALRLKEGPAGSGAVAKNLSNGATRAYNMSLSIAGSVATAIPEPSSALLACLAGLGFLARRNR